MSANQRSEQARLSGWRSAAIWLVVVADMLVLLLSAQVDPRTPAAYALLLGVVASFGAVGAIVAVRRPRNVIGWILWMTSTATAWSTAGVTYATYSLDVVGGTLPWTTPIAFVSNVALLPLIATVAIFVPLLFPDGHLPSARWRSVAWLGVAAIGVTTFGNAFAPGMMSGGAKIENPLGIHGFEPLGPALGVLAVISLVTSLVLAVGSVIWRYRHGNPMERQQTRWFALAAVSMVVTTFLGLSDVGPFAEAGWLVMLAGLALVPIATGVAILRYRLYDLDRLVSRTIGYALVTGLLVATYAALILFLEGPLSSVTNGDTLPVALSTLAVAALFQPVRQRVQRAVDRRFDRAWYDAERLTAAFSERLRDEVDLPTLTNELDATVRRAIAPASLGLWLREAKR